MRVTSPLACKHFASFSGNVRTSAYCDALSTSVTEHVPCRQAQLQRGHEDYQSIARREQREQEKRRVDQARDAERKSREEVCIHSLLHALLSACFLPACFSIILQGHLALAAAVHTSQFSGGETSLCNDCLDPQESCPYIEVSLLRGATAVEMQ